MFENLGRLFKRMVKTEPKELDVASKESKETAKERLHMVLMQDRANVSADFLELMKEEIIDVIKKYIEVDEDTIDVRLTTQTNEDGTNGTPSLYANIPILNIRNDMKVENFNFQLQGDGSIIAHKIEEKEEMENNKANEIKAENLNENDGIETNNIEVNNINSESISKIEIIENIELQNEEQLEKIEEQQQDNVKEINNSPVTIEEISKEINNESIKIQELEENRVSDKGISMESIQNLKKSAKRGRPKKNKREKIKRKKSNDMEESLEDDDDDVTFDDLLKAAEEEDRKKAEQEKKRGI